MMERQPEYPPEYDNCCPCKACEDAEAEVERLGEELRGAAYHKKADIKLIEHFKLRTESAEAEIERLRDLLDEACEHITCNDQSTCEYLGRVGDALDREGSE